MIKIQRKEIGLKTQNVFVKPDRKKAIDNADDVGYKEEKECMEFCDFLTTKNCDFIYGLRGCEYYD